MSGQHLVVAITPHGYGHGAQVAPVVDALAARVPGLRVTVQTTLPEGFLRQRIRTPFDYQAHATDFGLQMHSSLDIDLERSATRYRAFHQDWDAHLAGEAEQLAALQPDLVLADIPYLPLAAAQRLGIPNAALCSLNWREIYRHYFADRPEAGQVLAHMESAYGQAAAFLCPAPSMEMPGLGNVRPIGPLARVGENRRERIGQRLGLEPGQRLVLIAPGGVRTQLPIEHWPRGTGIHWLLASSQAVDHPDVTPVAALAVSFSDILASADAVLGKLGYGTVAECACAGTAMLFIPRPDWPEERFLLDWLKIHGRCAAVSRARVERGELREVLEACLDQARPPAPEPRGDREAADYLAGLLETG